MPSFIHQVINNHILTSDTEVKSTLKAFDWVSWPFLYRELGFSTNFVNCIQSLYNNPSARIKINGHLTDSLKLFRGTRQECRLSPTLFTVYIAFCSGQRADRIHYSNRLTYYRTFFRLYNHLSLGSKLSITQT